MAPAFISGDQIAALNVGPREVREEVEKVFLERAAGKALLVPKVGLYPAAGGLFHAMPAAVDGLVVMKWLTVGAQRREGVAPLQSTILATDPRSGELVAVMDGKWVTAVRTAAVTAIAAQLVFGDRPIRVSFVGGGAQALAHIDALFDAFTVSAAKVLSRSSESTLKIRQALERHDVRVTIAAGASDLLQEVDLVVTSISLDSPAPPFLSAESLQKGVMVSMVDLGKSWMPETSHAFTQVITDDLPHTIAVKNLIHVLCEPSFDLPNLLVGSSRIGAAERNVTLFVAPGVAIADAAVARIILRRLNLLPHS